MAGLMTLTEMLAEVRYNIDNREATDISDTQLTGYINWSYLYLSTPKVYRHPALQLSQTIPMVSGTYSYALASNLGQIYDVSNANDGYRLKPRDRRWFVERPRSSGGRPGIYTKFGESIYVHATPNASDVGKSLVVDYWGVPARLSGTAVTVYSSLWDEIIVMGAVWRAWRSLNRPDHAEIAKQDFGAMINEITDTAKIEGEDWDHQISVEVQRYQET